MGNSFPSIRLIAETVAEHCGLDYVELISQRRTETEVRARTITAGIARRLTPRSLPAIGGALGDRDHTTILHAIRRFEERLATEPDFAADVAAIEHQVLAIAACWRLRQPPSDPQDADAAEIAQCVIAAHGAIWLEPYALMALAAACARQPKPEAGGRPESAPMAINIDALEAARAAARAAEGSRKRIAAAAAELAGALDAADDANFADRGAIINARKRVASARAALAGILSSQRTTPYHRHADRLAEDGE